jgi:hypothetical protein
LGGRGGAVGAPRPVPPARCATRLSGAIPGPVSRGEPECLTGSGADPGWPDLEGQRTRDADADVVDAAGAAREKA